jgi:hypothetical protein
MSRYKKYLTAVFILAISAMPLTLPVHALAID